MADRNEFLERIRTAAASGRRYQVSHAAPVAGSPGYVGGGADLPATLLAEWIAVGGKGARVKGPQAAREYINRYLDQQACRSALFWRHPLLTRLELDGVFSGRGIAVAHSDELERQPAETRWSIAFDADVGVTSVDWAVAETGTLALCAQPGQGRAASLLPARYLAIIETAQIVPDLFDLFEKLEPEKQNLPSNITLVTGPSKTGDIELKLTTGVHGPGDVTLLIVEPSS